MLRPKVTWAGVSQRAVWGCGAANQILRLEAISDGVMDAFTYCISLWFFYGCRFRVTAKPLFVDDSADVCRRFTVDRVEFDSPCSCVNHADGMDLCNFLAFCFYCPGTKKVGRLPLRHSGQEETHATTSDLRPKARKIDLREVDAAFVGQERDIAELDNKPIFGVLDVSSLVVTLSFVDGGVVHWEGVG
eukprot:8854190-Ditylum_brightwellii.AAC.1